MEVINSFFSNIKDKLTNPYFGTLILVLVFHHWELLYTIFNFDEEVTLNSKLESIKTYISNNLTFTDLLLDALWALIFMLSGYLIIVITRSIVLWVEFWLMPIITGKIINKNVVQKVEYDKVVKEREEYFDQYEEQRENVRTFSKTIDEQTDQIKQKDKELVKQSSTISKTIKSLDSTTKELEVSNVRNEEKNKKIKQLTENIERLNKDIDVKSEMVLGYEQLILDEENKELYSAINKFPPRVIEKVRELKRENKWNAFLSLGNFYNHGGTISGELLTEMANRQLAFERGSHEGLTAVGKVIYRYNKIFDNHLDENLLLLR